MTEITRDVIIDLLPAYFAGEASEHTHQLVDAFFEQDPEFAQMAQRMHEKLLQTTPVQLPQSHEMKTLRRTQNAVMWRVIGIAIALAFVTVMVLIGMAFFIAQ
jgi:hypothetical protein